VVSLRCWHSASHTSCTVQLRRHASHSRDNHVYGEIETSLDLWNVTSQELLSIYISDKVLPTCSGLRLSTILTFVGINIVIVTIMTALPNTSPIDGLSLAYDL
jgi:hypothetical protein